MIVHSNSGVPEWKAESKRQRDDHDEALSVDESSMSFNNGHTGESIDSLSLSRLLDE